MQMHDSKIMSNYSIQTLLAYGTYHNFYLGSNVAQIIKMTFLDVLLPTLDVYGDVSLIVSWHNQGYNEYAAMMTIPLMLNYLFMSYKW